MSKLKLFLLGGIFTLVGIFNFSSAESYNGMSFTCSVGGQIEGYNECGDDYLQLNIDKGNYILNANSQLDSFNFNGAINLGGNSCTLNNGKTHLSFPGNYDLICSEQTDITLNIFNVNTIEGDTPALVTFSISQNSGGGTSGEGGEGGQVLSGGFSSLTPAIEGIHNTTKQLIPLVVYIGIGILLVILGFIAIRWLVGWLVVKINNYFSSKRG